MGTVIGIRQLEWEPDYRSVTILGTYHVFRGNDYENGAWCVTLDGSIVGYGDTRTNAQCAAQSDYERRITSALFFEEGAA